MNKEIIEHFNAKVIKVEHFKLMCLFNNTNTEEFKKFENVNEEKKWQIFKLDDSKTIVLALNGEIIWGDMMFLWFQKKNGK